MAKNLQEYLDKHKGCEVYKGQDNPDQPARANPMEQVLTDEGEYEFYYQVRSRAFRVPEDRLL